MTVEAASLASRDSLTVVMTRPQTAAGVIERPLLQARREAQHAATSPRVTAASSAGTSAPPASGGAAVPARIQATLAADRALFTVLTAGRQSITEQANLLASQNAARFQPFITLLGSTTPMPARATARPTVLAKVRAAYADPRDEDYTSP